MVSPPCLPAGRRVGMSEAEFKTDLSADSAFVADPGSAVGFAEARTASVAYAP